MTWKETLRSWISSVRFWKDNNVPGVADQIRKTKLTQDQRSRQNDMQELLKMVQEGRLHEADERQLANLKLAMELNQILAPKSQAPIEVNISTDIIDAVREVVADQLAKSGTIYPQGVPAVDPDRPVMKQVTLGTLSHEKEDLHIQGDLKGDVGKSADDAAQKREMLKKIKGG